MWRKLWRGGAEPRLAMSLLVRDEADLVAANIDYHAAQGVDCFIVTDNASADGTREILESLRGKYDLEILDEPGTDYRQDVWVTRMANRIREQRKADWIIHNDADEFWIGRSGSLKGVLLPSRPVMECARFNMLPLADEIARPDFRFWEATLKVARPLGMQPPAPDPRTPLEIPIMLRWMPPKIMCRVDGLRYVARGNHHVEHDGGPAVPIFDVTILHYPVRRPKEFLKKTEQLGDYIAAPTTDPRDSWHLRRRHAHYLAGEAEDDYRSHVLTDTQARELLERGVLVRDETLLHWFQRTERA